MFTRFRISVWFSTHIELAILENPVYHVIFYNQPTECCHLGKIVA